MYTYDTLDRLTQADYLVGVLTEDEQFTYDSLGNRTNVNLRNGTDEVYYLANPNLNNQYTAIGVNSLTHDNAGNMTECNLDYTYEYDYENRLNKITKNSSTKAEYTYDALGRRIEKIAGGVTTRYYYDGWRVLTETDENEAVQREYVYGNYLDEVLIMIVDDGQNQTDHYYAHDHLFSPVALIADDGTVEERYEYDAYGRMARLDPDFTAWSGTPAGNPYYFTGQRLDELDSGALLIMYYKNRYYLTDLGRFIQTDPLGINDGLAVVYFADNGSPTSKSFNPFAQYTDGMNLFEYVQSGPINKHDLYGLRPCRPSRWTRFWDWTQNRRTECGDWTAVEKARWYFVAEYALFKLYGLDLPTGPVGGIIKNVAPDTGHDADYPINAGTQGYACACDWRPEQKCKACCIKYRRTCKPRKTPRGDYTFNIDGSITMDCHWKKEKGYHIATKYFYGGIVRTYGRIANRNGPNGNPSGNFCACGPPSYLPPETCTK